MYLFPNLISNKVPMIKLTIPGCTSRIVPSCNIAKTTHIAPVNKKNSPRIIGNFLRFNFNATYPIKIDDLTFFNQCILL